MPLFTSNQKAKYRQWKLEQKKKKSAMKIKASTECARRKEATQERNWGHEHPKR